MKSWANCHLAGAFGPVVNMAAALQNCQTELKKQIARIPRSRSIVLNLQLFFVWCTNFIFPRTIRGDKRRWKPKNSQPYRQIFPFLELMKNEQNLQRKSALTLANGSGASRLHQVIAADQSGDRTSLKLSRSRLRELSRS